MPSLLKAVLPLLLLTHVAAAAGRDLATPPIGVSPYAQQRPLVAAARGMYLTVWLESLDRAGWRTLGAFTDAEGNRISPTPFVIPVEPVAGPVHLVGGDDFTLFLPHDEGAQMLELDFEGHVIATRLVPIQDFRSEPAVARVGSRFAAIERTEDDARVVFFDRAGVITRTVTLPCRPIHHQLHGVGNDAFVAGVCASGGGLRLDRIASDGSVTTTVLDPLHAGLGVNIATGSNGGGTRVVWASTDLEQSLKTAVVGTDGSLWDVQTIASGGGQPYEPLLVRDTPSSFVAPYLHHGKLHIAKAEDGAITTTEAPPNDFGRPASAALLNTNILVADVHYESQASRGRVRTRLVDGAAQIGTTEILSIGPARQSAPGIGAGSGSLVGVWTETTATTSEVKAARIAADGTPLGSSLLDVNATLASDDVAWNGSHSLAVIVRNGQMRVRRIDAFGASAGNAHFLMDFPTNVPPRATVVWAADHWEVAWTDSVSAFRAVVAPDGSAGGAMQLPLVGLLPDGETERGGIYEVALVHDGERVLVAWTEGQFYPCPFECIQNRPAFIAAIDPAAMTIGPVHRISDPYALVESLSLAPSDGTIVAIMNDFSGRATAVALDETLAPAASRTFDGVGDVAWDGTSFVLALRERTRLALRRLDVRLRDAAPVRATEVAPADIDYAAPSVAVAIPGNAIIGIQDCDPTRGCRAVAYSERELALGPQRRRTVRR